VASCALLGEYSQRRPVDLPLLAMEPGQIVLSTNFRCVMSAAMHLLLGGVNVRCGRAQGLPYARPQAEGGTQMMAGALETATSATIQASD
jgi:hypothetical protein